MAENKTVNTRLWVYYYDTEIGSLLNNYMFNANKYSRWYNTIVQNAQSRITLSPDIYVELHHIIPRSLGGLNNNGNKVALTAKEHFICHLLLPKMTMCEEHTKKMNYAFWRMANATNKRYKTTSKIYEMARIAFVTGQMGHPNYLKKQTPAARQLISATMKQTLSILSAEEKYNRIKNSCSSTESWTEERKHKISKALTGIKRSEETRDKISTAVKNRTSEQIANFIYSNRGKPWSDKRRAAYEAKKGKPNA